MTLGLQPPKAQVDETVGAQTRALNVLFTEIGAFKAWLDGETDTDLADLGYTPGEVAELRSAYVDLDQLRTIYIGAASLASAKDFRTFAKRMWHFGFVRYFS